ncbi:MAG: 4Fe-4S binding protein [Methanothrix sp.]|jgi:Formate hydrogenlyase subunit 6/NADH:ubiquinone oxidoreductase 23 kD subunit (chain I)|uniref:4Fe-4S ferredoxin, iron-sulfur binding domain protein n=1 Tax=Methanothrix harundinacea TaxID=301375 RepID=A0A124G372_9EURY|nr:MAG: 4Fe-4S ferredoxin [Methanosaeta sp. SDB]KUK44204.1 MAG: 4Fe-4S ferredoxin, iron-sulfur binding domain protein [Methanothrix harundinacea]MDD2637635.1 4Fe-4S binding protein [Methanothrix sp.]MDI9398440.1 4Fe-4S binding protein [Euryarchaeota archaeon]KUK96040.1 MAG: 4Fe-4S ferredoxin, iron-sulfur binding domain protein [Methanothrix harundinacea]
MIKVDDSLCIGCKSCSNVCPSQNIVRTETEKMRSIHWKRCKEECDLCVEFCPARALTLVPFDETVQEPDLSFDLVACKICGSRYASEPMLRRIEAALAADSERDSEGLEWIRVCPTCRRSREAEMASRETVLERCRRGQ